MSCKLPLETCIASANTGLDAIKRAPIVEQDTGIRCLRIQDVSQVKGFENWGFTDVTPANFKKFQLKKDDILIARTGGSIGVNRYIEEDLQSVYNNGLIRIRVDIERYDPKFVFYLLRTESFKQHINAIAFSTAAQPNMKIRDFLRFEFLDITLEQQKLIARSLTSLDRKIDLNKKTNQTLEEMAQAIFKSWFVDFDPVKAKMNGEQPEGMDAITASLFPEKLVSDTGLPEGWRLSEIGDEVTVVGGGTPSKKNDDFWVDGHIHWTSPKDLSGVQDKVLLDTASKLTEAGLKKVSSGLLPVDTVLLSSRAPVGYLALAKVPLAVNQGYIAMKCEKDLPPEFVLQWCVHRMDEIKQRASGSTFAEISKKNFKPISVVVPSEDVLRAYQKLVKPLYDAITSNARQSEQLASLRDTLLPKLLSGELPLSD